MNKTTDWNSYKNEKCAKFERSQLVLTSERITATLTSFLNAKRLFYERFRTCNVVIIYIIEKAEKKVFWVLAYVCLPSRASLHNF